MIKKTFFCLLIFCILIMCLPAQENGQAEPADGEAGPEDPGMILPSIVLEIEDLSVEKVDAGLPEESDLLLPERKLFLPEDVTLDITEPQFNIDLTDPALAPGDPDSAGRGGTGTQGGSGSPIIAEAMLGAGNVNCIVSRISFYKPGSLPRFRFLFGHELADGFSSRSAGIGYNSRLDELYASVLFNLGKAELESAVTFKDVENGLQEQGDYFSVINRYLQNRNQLKYKLNDTFTFSGGLDYDLTSLILTGGDEPPSYEDAPYNISYYPPSEILLAPELRGDFSLGAVNLGLSAGYEFRKVLDSASFDFHRMLILSDLRVEFPFWLTLSGNVGYFLSSLEPVLVPFGVALSGSPSQYFTFGLRGGYFLEENNFSNLFTEIDFIDVPDSLVDNHGWFGGLAMNINLAGNKLALLVDALIRWNNTCYFPGSEIDAGTGLRSLSDVSGRITSDISAGIRWNMTDLIGFNLSYNSFVLWNADDDRMENRFQLDGEYRSKGDDLGIKLSNVLEVRPDLPLDLPVMNLDFFYRTSSNMRLGVEVEDILSPFMDDRTLAGPFISQGIKGIAKIEINF